MSVMTPGKWGKKNPADIMWMETESNRLCRPLTRSHKIVDISFCKRHQSDGLRRWRVLLVNHNPLASVIRVWCV